MSEFSSGLTVTVLGMSLVFFALIVVMGIIVGLDRLFPGSSEDQELVSKSSAPEIPASADLPALVDAPRSSVFDLRLGDRNRVVDLGDPSANTGRVVVDGTEYQIDQSESGQLVVNGERFSVRTLASTPTSLSIAVGEEVFGIELPAARAVAVAAPSTGGLDGGEMISAPLPGKVLRVSARMGERVKRGQEICVIEAMKMENSISAPRDGLITELAAQVGALVKAGQPLARLDGQGGSSVAAPPVAAPRPVEAAPETAHVEVPAGGEPIVAPLPGKALRVSVTAGAHVKRGQEICVIEAMKMENSIGAPRDGTVRALLVQQGQNVKAGQTLATLD